MSAALVTIHRWMLSTWVAMILVVAPQLLHAQTIDDIDVQSTSAGQLVRIRFNASVRFMQQSPGGMADLYLVRFELISADEQVLKQSTDEFRRVPAASGVAGVAIGYAASPGSRVKQLTINLAQKLAMTARQGPNGRSIDLVFKVPEAPAAGLGAAAGTAAPPEPSRAVRRYSVNLLTRPVDTKDSAVLIPKEFQDYEVVTSETTVNGVPSFEVTVGYFTTREQAEGVRSQALARFPQARVVDMAAVPSPADSIGTIASRPDSSQGAGVARADDETERTAAVLLQQAREAIAANKPEAAITLLNQSLKLPPNSTSMAAQETIGGAWEMAGSQIRARAEYGLYMKLYPQGEGAARVAARLSAISGTSGGVSGADGRAASPRSTPPAITGNVAQYYYGGKAKSQSLVNISSGIDQSTLSKTTESAIVTSVDLSGKYATADSDTRVVVRGSASNNLLSASHSSNSIGAAYVDYRRSGQGLELRAGRQSPISGGLLGLFDGVSAAYKVTEGLKLDIMGGVPASALVSSPSERLYAAVLEADSILEHWGGNVYLLGQSTEGIANRRSLGGELRYAGDAWSLNSLADYDILFRQINALSVHSSFQAPGQTSITVLLDERRAPSLQMTNALISTGAASLRTLLQTRSLDQVRSDALATSAKARQLLFSVARPLNERWQMAMDLRYSAIGALPAVGDFAATPATGAQYSYSAQLTGTNLYSTHDISNVTASVITTPFFRGAQIGYNNLTAYLNNDLTVESSLRVYTQRDTQDVRLTRFGPGLRMTYRASRRASLLAELLYERSKTDGPQNHDNSQSAFFYVGYRYESF